MNFLTEQHFNTAMGNPKAAAEVVSMLVQDLSICIAILGGPQGDEATYRQLIKQCGPELLAGALEAQRRLKAHLAGTMNMVDSPSGMIQ